MSILLPLSQSTSCVDIKNGSQEKHFRVKELYAFQAFAHQQEPVEKFTLAASLRGVAKTPAIVLSPSFSSLFIPSTGWYKLLCCK